MQPAFHWLIQGLLTEVVQGGVSLDSSRLYYSQSPPHLMLSLRMCGLYCLLSLPLSPRGPTEPIRPPSPVHWGLPCGVTATLTTTLPPSLAGSWAAFGALLHQPAEQRQQAASKQVVQLGQPAGLAPSMGTEGGLEDIVASVADIVASLGVAVRRRVSIMPLLPDMFIICTLMRQAQVSTVAHP